MLALGTLVATVCFSNVADDGEGNLVSLRCSRSSCLFSLAPGTREPKQRPRNHFIDSHMPMAEITAKIASP